MGSVLLLAALAAVPVVVPLCVARALYELPSSLAQTRADLLLRMTGWDLIGRLTEYPPSADVFAKTPEGKLERVYGLGISTCAGVARTLVERDPESQAYVYLDGCRFEVNTFTCDATTGHEIVLS